MGLTDRAVSQLSRMSLHEFNNERQTELNLGDYGTIPMAQGGNQVAAVGETTSRSGLSTVSKPVQQSNANQLDDFRSKLGLMNEEQLQEFKA